ncbi:MAG: hypothetical protein K2H72_08455 [Muribaculaceae bacterium]|nr:hypothetical protein [Muribaculaceae bacterium]
MATTQKQASIARNVVFRAKGGGYTAFLHASTGNLIQQYDDEGNYYPEITPTNPIRLQFTATSSRAAGAITPDSITYKVAGVALAFDNSGNCTTSGASSYFHRDGADLLIIGNIAEYLGKVSSLIEATAIKGQDTFYAHCQAEISKYQGGGKVSIAPGDAKNFTLSSQGDSVRLKAGVLLKTGWSYNSSSMLYVWEIADPSQTSGWRCLQVGKGAAGTLIIHASQVNTYSNIRCTVLRDLLPGSTSPSDPSTFTWTPLLKNRAIGSDCVGVLDASDPLDIICSVKINKTGTGTEVDAEEEALDDTMPATAYLIYTPTLVIRGQTGSAGSTTWLNGLIVDPAGVTTRNIIPSNGKYKVLVSDVSSSYGEHTLIMSGKLN